MIDTSKSLAYPSDIRELEECLGAHPQMADGWSANCSIYVRASVLREIVAHVRHLETLLGERE